MRSFLLGLILILYSGAVSAAYLTIDTTQKSRFHKGKHETLIILPESMRLIDSSGNVLDLNAGENKLKFKKGKDRVKYRGKNHSFSYKEFWISQITDYDFIKVKNKKARYNFNVPQIGAFATLEGEDIGLEGYIKNVDAISAIPIPNAALLFGAGLLGLGLIGRKK